MSDGDLEQIRKARLSQLQQQQQQQQQAGRGNNGAGQDAQEPDSQRVVARLPASAREAEARQAMLSQILLPEAADRLGRIRLVKESRATDVENRLIMLARSGQLRQKITEAQLKDILGAVSERAEKQDGQIVVQRRGGWDDEDEDLLDL